MPDETDLMYIDETAADVTVAAPECPERLQEPHAAVYEPVPADRPRREVRPPTWMRDFVS